MKATLLVAGCLGSLAISHAASADTYLGAGIGTQPGVNDEFIQHVGQPSGRSLRGLIGWRFGKLSLEGALNGFTVPTTAYGEKTAYQLSGALKVSLPLGNNFEAFFRGGIERTWLNQQTSNGTDLMGDGFLAGAGFEYRLDAVLANASLFVDYTVHHVGLESRAFDTTMTTRFWGLGLTVGL